MFVGVVALLLALWLNALSGGMKRQSTAVVPQSTILRSAMAAAACDGALLAADGALAMKGDEGNPCTSPAPTLRNSAV